MPKNKGKKGAPEAKKLKEPHEFPFTQVSARTQLLQPEDLVSEILYDVVNDATDVAFEKDVKNTAIKLSVNSCLQSALSLSQMVPNFKLQPLDVGDAPKPVVFEHKSDAPNVPSDNQANMRVPFKRGGKRSAYNLRISPDEEQDPAEVRRQSIFRQLSSSSSTATFRKTVSRLGSMSDYKRTLHLKMMEARFHTRFDSIDRTGQGWILMQQLYDFMMMQRPRMKTSLKDLRERFVAQGLLEPEDHTAVAEIRVTKNAFTHFLAMLVMDQTEFSFEMYHLEDDPADTRNLEASAELLKLLQIKAEEEEKKARAEAFAKRPAEVKAARTPEVRPIMTPEQLVKTLPRQPCCVVKFKDVRHDSEPEPESKPKGRGGRKKAQAALETDSKHSLGKYSRQSDGSPHHEISQLLQASRVECFTEDLHAQPSLVERHLSLHPGVGIDEKDPRRGRDGQQSQPATPWPEDTRHQSREMFARRLESISLGQPTFAFPGGGAGPSGDQSVESPAPRTSASRYKRPGTAPPRAFRRRGGPNFGSIEASPSASLYFGSKDTGDPQSFLVGSRPASSQLGVHHDGSASPDQSIAPSRNSWFDEHDKGDRRDTSVLLEQLEKEKVGMVRGGSRGAPSVPILPSERARHMRNRLKWEAQGDIRVRDRPWSSSGKRARGKNWY